MVRVKTSIYIDKDLWERLKEYVSRRNIGVSRFLEDLIREGIVEEALDNELLELAGHGDYEVDFEPVEPREGLVSELIRVMRDERADRLSR